jgi:hypothetical protein
MLVWQVSLPVHTFGSSEHKRKAVCPLLGGSSQDATHFTPLYPCCPGPNHWKVAQQTSPWPQSLAPMHSISMVSWIQPPGWLQKLLFMLLSSKQQTSLLVQVAVPQLTMPPMPVPVLTTVLATELVTVLATELLTVVMLAPVLVTLLVTGPLLETTPVAVTALTDAIEAVTVDTFMLAMPPCPAPPCPLPPVPSPSS